MTTPLELADRLEAARLASGLSRQALTEQAGVSRQAVYRLLKGNDVQVSTLLAVTEVLQLDLVTLPRALKRGLPELGDAPAVAATATAPLQPSPASSRPSSHVMSAVQRRLADLKGGRS
ncbi:MAG: XRE family transcriptional regulator [Variovorax sp.]|nr:MAG: XRE family transcriptional regulator [Variovorax sp.]